MAPTVHSVVKHILFPPTLVDLMFVSLMAAGLYFVPYDTLIEPLQHLAMFTAASLVSARSLFACLMIAHWMHTIASIGFDQIALKHPEIDKYKDSPGNALALMDSSDSDDASESSDE